MATTTIDQATANKAVVRRLYDLINDNDLGEFGTIIGDTYVDRSNGSKGPDGVAAAAANLHRASADLRIELVDVIGESDLVVVRWRETGRARRAVPETLQALGINAAEKMKALNVEIERGVLT